MSFVSVRKSLGRVCRPAGVTLLFFAALCSVSEAEDIQVTSPRVGAALTSPLSVQAIASSCQGQPVAAMGYSMDDSAQTSVANQLTLNSVALASTGQHVLHVKAWGTGGSSCSTSIPVNVVDGSMLPQSVTVTSNLQRLGNWSGNHDPGSSGATAGFTTLAANPSISGSARQYSMNFQNSGGEIFHSFFDVDTQATNFVYDTQILLTSNQGIANLEFDLNQVIANGQTVIFGVQCDGWSRTWDYTLNNGTPFAPLDTWVHSDLPCDPRTWTANVWHHVQIAYSRDTAGDVTYHSVSLDGQKADFINATGNSAFALNWSPTLLTNFQIDGRGNSGSATAYLDNLTIYRW